MDKIIVEDDTLSPEEEKAMQERFQGSGSGDFQWAFLNGLKKFNHTVLKLKSVLLFFEKNDLLTSAVQITFQ